MKYLADTHVLLWAAYDTRHLSARVKDVLSDPGNVIYISPVSAYEIVAKHRRGKLPEAAAAVADYSKWVASLGFEQLSLTGTELALAGSFSAGHEDPWDRVIAAQSIVRVLPVLSVDTKLDLFPVTRVW